MLWLRKLCRGGHQGQLSKVWQHYQGHLPFSRYNEPSSWPHTTRLPPERETELLILETSHKIYVTLDQIFKYLTMANLLDRVEINLGKI